MLQKTIELGKQLTKEEMRELKGGLAAAKTPCDTASDCPPYIATCDGKIVAPPTATCRNGSCVWAWGC